MKGMRWLAMLGVVGVLSLGLAAPAVYAHGGDTNLIHTCVSNKGALRVVFPTEGCKSGEFPLDWNSQGAPGPQGLQGIQGPPGVLGSFDDLAGLPCTKPGGGGGVGSVAVIYRGDGIATVACATGRYLDLGLVVFDTQTNLMWEKKVAGSGCLHCVDDTYTWCQATGNASGICGGNTTSWIADVNAEGGTGFAGYSDWRVPTGVTSVGGDGGELATILLAPSPCGTSPCIDPIFGPTASFFYWSATEVAPNDAWLVSFTNGGVNLVNKGSGIHVRAVRGGP